MAGIELIAQPVPTFRLEEQRYQGLMQAHHYLGDLPKISETLWYLAVWRDQWVALISCTVAAWKRRARDQWVGLELHGISMIVWNWWPTTAVF
jgi:hypothetical protein